MKFETKVIHAGIDPDPSTGAIMTPIFQTSTYVQQAPGQHQGYEYGRSQNPTRTALQNNLAALENGQYCIAFSSGVAAADAVIRLLKPGDEILAAKDLYGGTYRLMRKIHEKFGISIRFIDMCDPAELKVFISEKTKMLWVESPTNPLLNIVDIKTISMIARERGVITCLDNTFASPYLQNPLDLGADIVVHSASKYLGGHSDIILGAVITNDQDIAENLTFIQNAAGAVPGPQDCFLTLRGIKTLPLRMERACLNTEKIARFLRDHQEVNQVFYPGFEDHSGHRIAREQMKMFGAVVSFNLKKDDMEKAKQIMTRTRYFQLAESLGGVESTIGHPPSMSHGSIPREERIAAGLLDSTIRLSVGVEHADDLIEDLEKALKK